MAHIRKVGEGSRGGCDDGLMDLDEEFENPTYIIPGIDDEDGYDYI